MNHRKSLCWALGALLVLWAPIPGRAQAFEAISLKGTTVTYWYQHSQGREAALQTLITRFNGTNPWGITVKGEYAGSYSDIANKMIAGIAGGATPDLVVAYQNNAATYQLSDALVDLNPYVNDKTYGISSQSRPDFFEGFLAQDIYHQYGDARLGWPPNRSVAVLYYNADWLKALHLPGPPKTWEEFYADCKAATDPAQGTYGYAINLDASNVFAQVISRGGAFENPGKGYRLDTPELRDSLAFMQTLFKQGYAHKVAENLGDQTDFANQKVLFTTTSTAGMPFYGQAVEKGAKGPFHWSVAALPRTTPEPVLDIYGASVSVVKSTPARQLAAWLFLRWMSEPAQQAEWVKASDYFPVRKSTAAGLTDYLAKNPQFAEAFQLLKESTLKAEPSYVGYDLVRDAITTAYNQVLDGAPVAPTLKALQEKADRLYRQGR